MEHYDFLKAKRDLESLNNIHATRLTQAQNRHEVEVKRILIDLDDKILEVVRQELKIHLELIYQAIQKIEQKVNKHFGA